jgi:hypothetical protein
MMAALPECGHNRKVRGVTSPKGGRMVALRSAALALMVLAAPAAAFAQDDQEQFKKNLEHKLEQPFLKNATWITDYDEAKAASKKSGKPIFAYFTRSYAR